MSTDAPDVQPENPDHDPDASPAKPLRDPYANKFDERIFSMKVNLAPNANPMALPLVKALELIEEVKFEMLRDVYVVPGPSGPVACMFVACGGDKRGAHGAFWNRVRKHQLYLDDVDSTEIQFHATIRMVVPAEVMMEVNVLLAGMPRFGHSPEEKQRLAREVLQNGGYNAPEVKMTVEEAQLACRRFIFAVEYMGALRGGVPGKLLQA